MTPHKRCPRCERDGRRLECSSGVFVTYFRCDPCGHVWCIDNHRPHLPPRDVTISPPTLVRELLL